MRIKTRDNRGQSGTRRDEVGHGGRWRDVEGHNHIDRREQCCSVLSTMLFSHDNNVITTLFSHQCCNNLRDNKGQRGPMWDTEGQGGT